MSETGDRGPLMEEPGDGPSSPPEAGEPAALLVPVSRLGSILESLLFAADRALSTAELAALVEEPDAAKVDAALARLAESSVGGGVQLHAVAGGWQLRTHPANARWVHKLVAQKPVRLTRAQLETLAIVSYRQPITRPEIDDIRGVDSGGTLKTLLDRLLIRILGKKEEPGRPLLYGTTREFLSFFNLRDLRDLPTLREFHELSDEHRAQVEALEGAAPPGAVERDAVAAGGGGDAARAPLLRVELSDAPLDEDLSHVDGLIESAGARALAATAALGGALAAPVEREPDEPDASPGEER